MCQPPSVSRRIYLRSTFRANEPLGWDDVGDFSSLAELLPAEANQPRILGDSSLGEPSAALHCATVTNERHPVVTEQVAGGIVVPGSGRFLKIPCRGYNLNL